MKRRNLIALLALTPLAACVVNLSFDIDKQFTLAGPAGTVTQTQTVDLSQYSAVQDHKGNIKSLTFDSARLNVASSLSGNTATTFTGTLVLRSSTAPADGSQDVPVGTLTNFSVAQGSTVTLPGNAALDAFLLSEVQGAGTFTAILSGQVNGVVNLVVDVDIAAGLGYDSGLF